MNKTSLHILISTGLFLGLIALIAFGSFFYSHNLDKTIKAEVAPVAYTPQTRSLPSLIDITPASMPINEGSTSQETEKIFLIFLTATFFLTLIFSIIIARLAQRPLKEALVRQKKFIADASHELKTPLSVVSSDVQLFTERLEADIPTKDEIRIFMEHLLVDIKRLTNITNDLLQVAKIDDGVNRQKGEVIPLARITAYLESLPNKMQGRFSTHHLEFSSEITEDINIHGAPADLMQVVEILVENACLHTKAGTEVELIQTLEDDQYQLRISDNGSGIAKEHLGRLFERFYQVPGTKGKVGTGLGLPIAKELIERWQGMLLVDSEVGVGTTMTIMLPIVKQP